MNISGCSGPDEVSDVPGTGSASFNIEWPEEPAAQSGSEWRAYTENSASSQDGGSAEASMKEIINCSANAGQVDRGCEKETDGCYPFDYENPYDYINGSENRCVFAVCDCIPDSFDNVMAGDQIDIAMEILVDGKKGDNGVYWAEDVNPSGIFVKTYSNTGNACAGGNPVSMGTFIGDYIYNLPDGSSGGYPYVGDFCEGLASGNRVVRFFPLSQGSYHGYEVTVADDTYNASVWWIDIPEMRIDPQRVSGGDQIWAEICLMKYGDSCCSQVYIGEIPQCPSCEITLMAPGSGESICAGSAVEILWTTTGNDCDTNVFLQYSIDGGATWNMITDFTANDGFYLWSVPEVLASASAQIRITDYSNTSYTAQSDFFDIVDCTPSTCTYTLISPDAGQVWCAGSSYDIEWASSGNDCGDYVGLQYSTDGGALWKNITLGVYDSGVKTWTIPQGVTSDQVKVRIWDSSNDRYRAESAAFSIVNCVVAKCEYQILTPNGGEAWCAGSKYDISWAVSGNDCGGSAKLQYSSDGGNSWDDIAVNIPNDGNFLWTVPGSLSTSEARIRVIDNNTAGYMDQSNMNFMINDCVPDDCKYAITAPNGGESWCAGTSQTISWTVSGNDAGSSVTLQYSADNGISWKNITRGAANSGSYEWIIPVSSASADALVRIMDDFNDTCRDQSDLAFIIEDCDEEYITISNECAARGVSIIDVVVKSVSGVVLAAEDFPCGDRRGTLENIAVGTGITFEISALDSSGTVLFKGKKTGVVIKAGSNNVGHIPVRRVE